eukprot:160956_1
MTQIIAAILETSFFVFVLISVCLGLLWPFVKSIDLYISEPAAPAANATVSVAAAAASTAAALTGTAGAAHVAGTIRAAAKLKWSYRLVRGFWSLADIAFGNFLLKVVVWHAISTVRNYFNSRAFSPEVLDEFSRSKEMAVRPEKDGERHIDTGSSDVSRSSGTSVTESIRAAARAHIEKFYCAGEGNPGNVESNKTLLLSAPRHSKDTVRRRLRRNSDHRFSWEEEQKSQQTQPRTSLNSPLFGEPVLPASRSFQSNRDSGFSTSSSAFDWNSIESSSNTFNSPQRSFQPGRDSGVGLSMNSFESNRTSLSEPTVTTSISIGREHRISVPMPNDCIAAMGPLVHHRVISFLTGAEVARAQRVARQWYVRGSSSELWGALLDRTVEQDRRTAEREAEAALLAAAASDSDSDEDEEPAAPLVIEPAELAARTVTFARLPANLTADRLMAVCKIYGECKADEDAEFSVIFKERQSAVKVRRALIEEKLAENPHFLKDTFAVTHLRRSHQVVPVAVSAPVDQLDVAAWRHVVACVFPVALMAIQYPTLAVAIAKCAPFLALLVLIYYRPDFGTIRLTAVYIVAEAIIFYISPDWAGAETRLVQQVVMGLSNRLFADSGTAATMAAGPGLLSRLLTLPSLSRTMAVVAVVVNTACLLVCVFLLFCALVFGYMVTSRVHAIEELKEHLVDASSLLGMTFLIHYGHKLVRWLLFPPDSGLWDTLFMRLHVESGNWARGVENLGACAFIMCTLLPFAAGLAVVTAIRRVNYERLYFVGVAAS